jgi:predicted ATPase/class 3 adenylate cyclase
MRFTGTATDNPSGADAGESLRAATRRDAGRRVCDLDGMRERRWGTLTFLLTDIEGSTRRWEQDREVMREALAVHDAVLRTAVEHHNGSIFKHTGDGVCAVFGSPLDAVHAAIEAQHALELPVRMGIATGNAEARDHDYFGPALNHAARVMAAGHGGQILLAESTATLVDVSGHIDLGVHALRDLSSPIRLTQVVDEGLESRFPPLRTLSAVHGNLLSSTSTFIGREEQTRQLAAAVLDQRLVTLTGAGGVGKTRLAAEVAAMVADRFADGAWVVELASTSIPAAVPTLLANVLNVTTSSGRTVTESVVDALQGKTLLIVIDNCEHVIEAAGQLVETVLWNTETVSFLATSREDLGIAGEQLWPVPPLDVTTGADSEAVRLFIERARAVNPQFELVPGSDDLDAVTAICRDLDGLALAIELAAARMVSMTPQEIVTRLDDHLRVLGSSRRGMTHHRTLRQTVAWSYDLLDDDERALLERCAVFANGFELESAVAICGEWDEFAILDLLESLVRKSLITADVGRDRSRYHMLETIRQFAEDQLDASGRTDLVRRAHAEHFARRSEEMWVVWCSPSQRDAIDWVDNEFAELRASFRWAAENDDIEVAARIASHTAMLSFVLQRFEPVTWVEEILEAATDADLTQLPRMYTAASICTLTGGQETAIRYAQTAVRLERDQRYEAFEDGWSTFWEASARRYTNQLDQFLEICQRLADGEGFAHVIGQCGLLGVLAGVGRQDEARALADDTLASARDLANPFWIAWAMTSWGRAHASHQPVVALEMLHKSLAYTEEHRIDYVRAIVLRELATLEETGGDLVDALEKFVTVIEWYQASGNRGSVTTALGDIAVMFDRLDRSEIAATIYGTSVPYGQSIAEELPSTVEHLREVLGNERFDLCVTAGASMEFNDAMLYVKQMLQEAQRQFVGGD